MSTPKKQIVTPMQAYSEGYFAAILRKPGNPCNDFLKKHWDNGYAKGSKVVEFHTTTIREKINPTGLQSWEL